ncbi:MAG: hypothetical protein JRI23_35000 [Deltaproteobacteria bacterium]|jgi:hypothetical protein|nr:hypothetical protein [Deltaproteobacteria bacterium]MBW2537516.1 hypothetical protein [Deltaproteobacteria bacterium]
MTAPSGPRCLAAGLLAAALGLGPVRGARSAEPVDGAYGRLDGDLSLGLEAGMKEAFPGEQLVGRLGCHYLHTLGAFAEYDEGFGRTAAPAARSLTFGVEVRPLFLPRFAQDLEQGPALLDLWLDSWALSLGVSTAALPEPECSAPSSTSASCWHTGLELGTGMELALLSQAAGPFIALRGAFRWPTEPSAAAPQPFGRPTAALSLSLGYRLVLQAHLVDAGDRAR